MSGTDPARRPHADDGFECRDVRPADAAMVTRHRFAGAPRRDAEMILKTPD